MTSTNAVLARVFVSGLDTATPLYQELADVADVSDVNHFAFRDAGLAQVGPFLLLAGNTAAYRDWVATILVERLGRVITAIENAGGQIVERRQLRQMALGLLPTTRAGRSSNTSRTGGAQPPIGVPETSPATSMTKSTTNSRHCGGPALAADRVRAGTVDPRSLLSLRPARRA